MLKKCAPGYIWDPRDHWIHVTYNGKTYRTLPTEHSSNGQVERGYVTKMAQFLGILECAKAQLPALN